MKTLRPLAVVVVSILFAVSLTAQESLPDSDVQKLAAIDHLQNLRSSDVAGLKFRAQSGAPEDQYLLGLAYRSGQIVMTDLAASRYWILQSAQQGYAPAETTMGEMYLGNQRTDDPVRNAADAERWLRQAATQGDAEAQLWLGIDFEHGYFGKVDYAQALQWMRKSAEQGLPIAQYSLAQMYVDGHGVPQSDENAAFWLRRAADHYSDVDGVFPSEVELAYMYRDGRLKANNVEAYKWFAVVGAAVDPPTDEDVKNISASMTEVQIAQARAEVDRWIAYHPPRPR